DDSGASFDIYITPKTERGKNTLDQISQMGLAEKFDDGRYFISDINLEEATMSLNERGVKASGVYEPTAKGEEFESFRTAGQGPYGADYYGYDRLKEGLRGPKRPPMDKVDYDTIPSPTDKPEGFAEGGPVGTSLPSIGTSSDQTGQDNSRTQFVEALTKLLKSLDQLNRSVEDQTKEMKDKSDLETTTRDTTDGGGGVTNNINISVNVDQNGQTSGDKKDENQDSQGDDMNDQEKFKKTMERSRVLAELLRQQILKVITEEQRPGGVLYQGSKGRDLGR
ncbi:hypothetical protein EBU71_23020, partial [bacterium]|nr:hypothetical protein [Candidatus Elulimicrobium humile]